MIELYVMGIALDTRTGTPIVVLHDKDNRRALPIWIGTAEASAIIRHLENIKSPRPMTHDLICTMLDKLGYRLVRVEINEISSDTYYATLFLEPPTDTTGASTSSGTKEKTPAPDKSFEKTLIEIDSRPSDAIALALRAEAPIFATANVVSEGTISTDQDRDEAEAAEFRSFLDNIKASDFKFDRDIESHQ